MTPEEMGMSAPGPWQAKRGKVAPHFVTDAHGSVIAVMAHGGQAEWPDEVLRAHALLVAAAPSLVALLEEFVQAAEDVGHKGNESDPFCRALSRARTLLNSVEESSR